MYSLGVTLYELLSLSPPFRAESRSALVHKVLYEGPAPLRHVLPSLPADMAAIVHKAMEKDPDRRYQAAGELAADLEQFLAGKAPKAVGVGPIGRAWRAFRRAQASRRPLARRSHRCPFTGCLLRSPLLEQGSAGGGGQVGGGNPHVEAETTLWPSEAGNVGQAEGQRGLAGTGEL